MPIRRAAWILLLLAAPAARAQEVAFGASYVPPGGLAGTAGASPWLAPWHVAGQLDIFEAVPATPSLKDYLPNTFALGAYGGTMPALSASCFAAGAANDGSGLATLAWCVSTGINAYVGTAAAPNVTAFTQATQRATFAHFIQAPHDELVGVDLKNVILVDFLPASTVRASFNAPAPSSPVTQALQTVRVGPAGRKGYDDLAWSRSYTGGGSVWIGWNTDGDQQTQVNFVTVQSITFSFSDVPRSAGSLDFLGGDGFPELLASIGSPGTSRLMAVKGADLWSDFKANSPSDVTGTFGITSPGLLQNIDVDGITALAVVDEASTGIANELRVYTSHGGIAAGRYWSVPGAALALSPVTAIRAGYVYSAPGIGSAADLLVVHANGVMEIFPGVPGPIVTPGLQPASVNEGGTATFDITATPNGSLIAGIQWFVDGVAQAGATATTFAYVAPRVCNGDELHSVFARVTAQNGVWRQTPEAPLTVHNLSDSVAIANGPPAAPVTEGQSWTWNPGVTGDCVAAGDVLYTLDVQGQPQKSGGGPAATLSIVTPAPRVCADASLPAKLTVYDLYGNSAASSGTLNVKEAVNDPPVIASPANGATLTAPEGGSWTLPGTITDDCGATGQWTQTGGSDILPAPAAPGQTVSIPASAVCIGATRSLHLAAADAQGGQAAIDATLQITPDPAAHPTAAPSVTPAVPAEGDSLQLHANASPHCGGAALSYAWSFRGSTPAGLPAPAIGQADQADATAALPIAVCNGGASYAYHFQVEVKEPNRAAFDAPLDVTLADVNQPPAVTAPPTPLVVCSGEKATFDFRLDDDCDALTWAFTASDPRALPSPPSGTTPKGGVVSAAIDLSGATLAADASATLTLSVSDQSGAHIEPAYDVALRTATLQAIALAPPVSPPLVLAPGGARASLSAVVASGCPRGVAFTWSLVDRPPGAFASESSIPLGSAWELAITEAAFPALLARGGLAVAAEATAGGGTPVRAERTLALEARDLVGLTHGSDRAALEAGEQALLTTRVENRLAVALSDVRICHDLAGLVATGPGLVDGADAPLSGCSGGRPGLVIPKLPPAGHGAVVVALPVRSGSGVRALSSAVRAEDAHSGVPISRAALSSGSPGPTRVGCGCGGGTGAAPLALLALVALYMKPMRFVLARTRRASSRMPITRHP